MSPPAGRPAERQAAAPAAGERSRAREPSAALAALLRTVPRRYPVPPLPASVDDARAADAGTALAFAIEHARVALDAGRAPAAALEPLFVDALVRLVDDALRTPGGDLAFQALLLQRQAPSARAYASLVAHAERDRRTLRAGIDAIAHPQKLARRPADALTPALATLQQAARRGEWPAVADAAQRLRGAPGLGPTAERLLEAPALTRLLRLHALADDDAVRRWRVLHAARGPAAGTPQALARGAGGQRRGDAGEARVGQVLAALAQRLDATAAATGWRAVSSLHTPPALAAGVLHAKTEWDVALLHEARPAGAAPVAELALLVEVKASADAAVADWPRLRRGLQCLAAADASAVLQATTREGPVALRGASLRTLVDGDAVAAGRVLYVCADATPPAPRRLSPAGRLQLLSAPAVLDFAARRVSADGSPGGAADGAAIDGLRAVWNALLTAPGWAALRAQYPVLCAVRARMVHVDDLAAAVGAGAG